MTSEIMIEMSSVHKWFGELHVLNDINLKLETVKRALKEDCSRTLKEANEALDKATEPMAVLIIEKTLKQ